MVYKVANAITEKPQLMQKLLKKLFVFLTLGGKNPVTIYFLISPELTLSQYLGFLIKTVIIYHILNFAVWKMFKLLFHCKKKKSRGKITTGKQPTIKQRE